MLNELRNELINRMIKIYGYENPIVIDFCRMCEEWVNDEFADKCLTSLVKTHEQCPQD